MFKAAYLHPTYLHPQKILHFLSVRSDFANRAKRNLPWLDLDFDIPFGLLPSSFCGPWLDVVFGAPVPLLPSLCTRRLGFGSGSISPLHLKVKISDKRLKLLTRLPPTDAGFCPPSLFTVLMSLNISNKVGE